MFNKVPVAIKIVFLYVLFGILWILLSDNITIRIFDAKTSGIVQTYKGIIYIILSGSFLYLIMHRAYFNINELKNEYENLVQNQTELIIKWKPDGRVLFVNYAYLTFFNLVKKNAYTQDVHTLYPIKGFQEPYLSQLNRDNTNLKCDSVIKKDNLVYKIDWLIKGIYSDSGVLLEIQAVGRDNSEQHRSKLASMLQDKQMELIIEGGELGTWEYNIVSRKLSVNSKWFEILGYRKTQELTDEFLFNSVHPDDLRLVKLRLEKHFASLDDFFESTHRIKHKSGKWIWVKSKGKVFEWDGDGNPIRMYGIQTDETEQKQIQMKIELSENLHRELIQNMNSGVVMTQLNEETGEFIITSLNPYALNALSKQRDEVIGKDIVSLYPHVEEIGLVEKVMQVYKTGVPALIPKVEYKDKDFQIMVQLYFFKLPSNGIACIFNDLTFTVKAEEKIAFLNKDLEKRIHERTAELELANQELYAFAYSVSHDLKAPLRAVIGLTEAVIEDYKNVLPEAGLDYLSRAADEGRRMSSLIENLLAMSNLNRIDMSIDVFNISELVLEVFSEIVVVFGEHIVCLDIDQNLYAKADYSLTKQLLENLISNAIKFSSKNDKPYIKFTGKIVSDNIVYSIEDNGVGFDMNYIHKVFAPFQRLHSRSQFEGDGIGLAIANRIISRHNGRIWCESELDKGSKFSFTLGEFNFLTDKDRLGIDTKS